MNIWEVVCIGDLVKILKESPNKFVFLGIVLNNTEKDLISFIKKFLKNKAEKYKNITFIFYKATQKDLNKISLLPSDTDEYPILYSIYDTSNIFVKVNRAIPSTINESFEAVKQYYDDDLEKFNTNNKASEKASSKVSSKSSEKVSSKSSEKVSAKVSAKSSEKVQVNNTIKIDENYKINSKESSKENSKENYKINSKENSKESSDKEEEEEEEKEVLSEKELSEKELSEKEDIITQQELMESQQLLMEKILKLQKKSKDYNIELLMDIKQRKKEESSPKKEDSPIKK